MNRPALPRFPDGEGRPDADRANALLERWEGAVARGLCPVKPHLTPAVLARAAEARFDAHGPLPERVRWLNADGSFRAKTLSSEELVRALRQDHCLNVTCATQMVQTYSGALEAADMDWLIARLEAADAARPLDGKDYAALVKAVDALADDHPLMADAVACHLGKSFDSYQPSPFTNKRLSARFRKAHMAHLQAQFDAADAAHTALMGETGATDEERSESRSRCKEAQVQASLAEHAVDGVWPSPSGLTLTLETADGRAVWCNVWKGLGACISACSSFEAQVFTGREGAGEQTLGFHIDVWYDDAGHSNTHFEGTGDTWRFLESNGLEDAVFQRLLAGDGLPEVIEQLSSPEPPMLSAM